MNFEIKRCGPYLGLYRDGQLLELAPHTKEGEQILKKRMKVHKK